VYAAASATASNPRPLHVESMRMHQGFALLRFREAPDRTQAERLRGLMLMVRLEDAVPLAEGEFYLYQVIGLSVHTVDGLELGTITEVLETGANDVYIVNGGPFGEVLIPVTPDTIVETDIPGGRLIVRLPDGLLPSPSEGDEPD
jgi:16S rRNA processing protein RimM